MELAGLFPNGTHVVSLPNSQSPRIMLMGCNPAKRWKESSFYPAYRLSAKAYRLLLRLKAIVGIHAVRLIHSDPWLVQEFVRDVLPNISSLVILVGTSSPTQKLIIQIWDEYRVIAYLKFAQSQAARKSLEREHELLRRLPPGLGPAVLRFGEMGNGKGLLLAPVSGKALCTRLPPPQTVWSFARSMETSRTVAIDSHPWIQNLRLCSTDCVDPWIDRLSKRNWPIVYQHGDLAPWNLFHSPHDTLVAVDWEYGTVEGFPYVDVIHYYLQVSLLIYKFSPHKAKQSVMQFLDHQLRGFSHSEIAALVNLSVLNTFKQAEQDGHSEHSYYQTWRRALWMI
jgi:hypothetical protein